MRAKYGVHLLTHSGYLNFCYIKMLINQKKSMRISKRQEENSKVRQALEREKIAFFP